MNVSLEKSNGQTFKSRLKMVTPAEFKELTKHYNLKKHEIGYPWQPENTKTGKKLFTTGIMDCIAGLVIDKNKATMFHLVTTSRGAAKKHHLKGFDIKKIQYKLLEKIKPTDENVHAFILGGFKSDPQKTKYNWTRMDKIKKIFKDNEIPYTILGGRKDVHFYGKFSFLYNHKDDTIYITNSLINARNLSNNGLETEILEDGKMAYNEYKRDPKTLYKRERNVGTAEDYMKSQFQEVELSGFDKWA